ncbi:MAG: pyruvate, phosphate dikinase [Candidatus Rokubacteria bacterium]|nr:pyruvate, phosphate dikinase [Candidatus Rokubacteria bacterium]
MGRPRLPRFVLPLSRVGAAIAERTGAKAATLATLRRAGLPVPSGFCVTAEAYRVHLASAGLADAAGNVLRADDRDAGRRALEVRLGLLRAPLPQGVAERLDQAYSHLCPEREPLVAVRSSALGESGHGASFAGQLQTFVGVRGGADVLAAVRACWASLWTPRAVRYARANGIDPAGTAVAVLVQTLVPATSAGGALSAAPDGRIVLTAAWGLGAAVAQGEVVPDRYLLRREGPILEHVEPGRKNRMLTCAAGIGVRWQRVEAEAMAAPCLGNEDAIALARLILRAETVLGSPLEVEWALDRQGFHLLQARPLSVETSRTPAPAWEESPSLAGQPASGGWAIGPARHVRSEAELARVQIGDVLVTRVPGPALAAVLPRVAAVVAELGGSTSHLAALARERGIPAVLGAPDAMGRIRDGALIVVDGTWGAVRPAPLDVEAPG